jgi:hypothetical protein
MATTQETSGTSPPEALAQLPCARCDAPLGPTGPGPRWAAVGRARRGGAED